MSDRTADLHGEGEAGEAPAEERTGYRSGDRVPAPSAEPVSRSTSDPAGHEAPSESIRCDLCGGPMIDRHCKLVCGVCGYQRDCSDP